MLEIPIGLGTFHTFAKYSDNGAFHWNGDGFVCLVNSRVHRLGKGSDIRFNHVMQTFGESSENTRKDNA